MRYVLPQEPIPPPALKPSHCMVGLTCNPLLALVDETKEESAKPHQVMLCEVTGEHDIDDTIVAETNGFG
jgi:hypothetical protein